jgi:integrase
LLWSIFQHKKAFSSLTAEDLKIYFEFIKDPQPADAWCGRTGSSYNHWRPFSGPVNSATQHTIRVVLHALMSFLVKGGYLKENPMPHFRLQDRIASDPITKTEINAPILMLDEWEALLKTLDDLPETSFAVKREKYRLRFIIEILFFLKLRVNDLAKYSWNAFYEENNQWWFLAAAKKDLSGPLPVSAELLAGIKNYRLFLGYSPMPTTDDNRPIIQRWQGKNPLRPVHINKMLKSLAIKAANLHFANEPQKYLKLKGFSAHWLRHFSLAMNDVLEVKDGVR